MTSGQAQPPGRRSGEGTQGLWDLIREDTLRKNPRPQDQRGTVLPHEDEDAGEGEPRFVSSGWGYGVPLVA